MRKTLATLAAGLLTAALAPAQMPPAVAPPPRPVESPAERQVFLSALIVEMPLKTVEQLRRDHAAAGTDPKAGAYAVADLVKLNEAIRREKGGDGIEILSAPNLMLTDRQTGFFQVGQQFPVVNADGTPPTTYVPTGLTLRVVPTIAADAQSVVLRTELQVATPNPTPVDLGNGKTKTAVDTQATQTTIRLATGKTIVVPSEIIKGREVVTQVRLGDGPIRFTLRRTEKTQVVLILTAETDSAKMKQIPPSQAMLPAVAVAPAAVCGNCYAETQVMPRPVAVVPPTMAQACPVLPTAAPATPPVMAQAVVPPVACVAAPVVSRALPTPPVAPTAEKQIMVQYTILDMPESMIPQLRQLAVPGTRGNAPSFELLDGTATVSALKQQWAVEAFGKHGHFVVLANNQTGCSQVGQQVSVPNGNGKTDVHVGFTLRTTPRLTPDGKIVLRVEPQWTSLSQPAVQLGNGTETPALNTQAAETTIETCDGRTTAIVTMIRTTADRPNTPVLFVTPRILQSAQTAVVPPPPVALVTGTPALPVAAVAPPVWTPPQPVSPPVAVPTLHRLTHAGVQVECQILELPDNFWPTPTDPRFPNDGLILHDAADVTKFLATARDEKTMRVASDVVLRATSGTPARVTIGGLRTTVAAPAGGVVPAVLSPLAPTLEVLPIRCGDRSVYLEVDYSFREPANLAGTTFYDGSLTRSVLAEAGGTVVLVGPKVVRDYPPHGFFFGEKPGKLQRQQYLVLTPTCDADRLAASAARTVAVPTPVMPVSELAILLAEYKAAVATGKTEDAMKFAMKALALDPTCFAK